MEKEAEIVAALLAGEWTDFDSLYDYYLPKIYRYIYNRIRHKQLAEDLTSAVFLKLVVNISSYRQTAAPFGAWLYRIARNTLIDHVRGSKPTQDLETAYNLSSKDDVASDVNTTLNLEAIRSELIHLTELQRDVLTLRVWEELSHQEIAEILEISEDSSKVTFSRAISALKEIIKV